MSADVSSVEQQRPSTTTIRPVRQVPVAGLLIGVVTLTWTAILVLQGYFWQDDFLLLDRATGSPLTTGYLLAAHNGNLTPGGNLVVWLVTRIAPMNYDVAVAPVLVLQLLALILLWRLLSGVFGSRAAILVPFTAFAAAPMLLSSSLWWAQALETMPLVVAMLGALNAQARLVRGGRTWQAVAGVLWVLAGLAFWDKALLIPLAVFGLTALLAPAGSGHTAVGWATRKHWPLWVAYLVVMTGYLIFYLTRTTGPGGRTPSFGDLPGLVARMIGQTFLPGALGGPWQAAEPYNTVWAFHAHAVLPVVWGLTVVAVVGSILLRRSRAALAWLVLLAYLLAVAVLLALARLDEFGTAAGTDPRYVADALPVAVVCGAFAFLRPANEIEPVDDRVLVWLRPAVAALTVSFVAGTVLTADTLWPQYSHGEAKRYVATAQDALAAQQGIALYDTTVPAELMVPWFGPAASTSTVLGGLPHRPPFDVPAENLRIIDHDGVPRPIELTGAAPAQPGPARDCGYPIRTDPVELPLASTVDGKRLVARLGYYSAHEVAGSVQAGRSSHDVTFAAGLHVLYVVVDGPVDKIRLWHNGSGDTVCVSDALVGTPVPSG